ncbi:hypothetical protein [Chitinophaga barathri]|uniref:Universal stress protein n=1 Tax=Chitinophaga barathri TaxID=1647451 RepID=A0A3N4MCT1_9BACT|nr:hypothetical protein [Chitinophaga barathri]RPD41732.1 hypothetical protein EG028_06065 [Chitinophaga barathri]
MQNIMIPTDLSIHSLSYLHNLAEKLESPCNIVLMHAQRLPDNLLDGWAFTRSKHHAAISDDFREACEVMKNRYANLVKSVQVEFFYGSTVPALRNFIHAHNISAIALPEQLECEKASKSSYNPAALMRYIKLPVTQLKITLPRRVVTAPASISELLGANY